MPEGVPVAHAVEVRWEGGMRYSGGREGGPAVTIDGMAEAGPSPVDMMLVALAGCSAIDVVDYLEKRRTPPDAVRVTVHFSRASDHPRRVTDAELVFHVAAATSQEPLPSGSAVLRLRVTPWSAVPFSRPRSERTTCAVLTASQSASCTATW